jgi:hypothetical protein
MSSQRKTRNAGKRKPVEDLTVDSDAAPAAAAAASSAGQAAAAESSSSSSAKRQKKEEEKVAPPPKCVVCSATEPQLRGGALFTLTSKCNHRICRECHDHLHLRSKQCIVLARCPGGCQAVLQYGGIMGDKMVPINVKTLTGKTICCYIDLRDKVEVLKGMIERFERIPIDQQRLIHDGRQLINSDRITAYIPDVPADGDEIIMHLVLRLGGS